MKNKSSIRDQKYNLQLLENKVCVITGAASLRSIGYATAEIFAAHGAKLVILDLEMNDQITSKIASTIASQTGQTPEIMTIQCDIRSTSDCDKAIERAVSTFGTIDCLVNCAGIVKSGGLLSIAEDEFDTILEVNLKGTFNICKRRWCNCQFCFAGCPAWRRACWRYTLCCIKRRCY
jgi:NAD(P)-dependent dehydrogenase (short-subunit alcohol dehydrogenase family)